ncbi:MAG TPA: carbonic anhydrase family protein [Thermoanaerobaculia bacterium]|nr:carbonic anhydrase family protein [Thermoanaerobaculia bacterium]
MSPRRSLAARRCLLVLGLAAGTAGVAAAAPARWSYFGATGPDRWPALSNAYAICGNGQRQSPIDLADAADRDIANPQTTYQPGGATVVDDGHTVEVDLDGTNILTLDGVPYRLVELHFHSPSEHTINGNTFAVEVHLVHQGDNGAVAVIAVFIAGGSENPALAPILSVLPSKENREARLREPFDPSSLLPDDRRAFRYTGSLTTPPCTEGVNWVVMASPISASGQQIAALARALDGNTRPVQARGDRELLLDTSP